MADVKIPDKLFFRIGEVCRLLNLEAYVLRFWETEFPTLSPTKGANGHRMYRKKDVEMVLTIKKLLYEKGFTIAGARRVLASHLPKDMSSGNSQANHSAERTAAGPPSSPNAVSPLLDQLKTELRDILTILSRRC